MKALECSQDFSHYKSIGIFRFGQGQLTPQSLVESGRNSNSSEILWLSSLPARIKMIRSRVKELECSQHYILLKKVLHHLIFTTFLSNVLYKYTKIVFKYNTAVEGRTHCLSQQ